VWLDVGGLSLQHLAQQNSYSNRRNAVKKIALIAVATLGLAACGGGNEAENTSANTAETDYNMTSENTTMDVNAAATDAQNAADAALDNAGAAIENPGEAVENASDAVEANTQ
jgi:hypothetical protein